MLIEASDLAVERGGMPVLEGLNFALAPGEALILRGPNGAGKTTLLRTLAGLQPALSGEIRHAPETLAYAGHADGLKSTLTVAENLGFWASVFGAAEIGPALDAYELRPLANRAVMTLSAGQKRRTGLARLNLSGRPVWLLDEPTVSLDSEAVAMFARAVGAHLHGGGAALIATHVELGIEARVLDVAPFRAKASAAPVFGGEW
jgi:heme exporter protein A